MRTGSLICLRVQKCLCVSSFGGKPSIYFLVNIGYFLRPSRRPSRRRRPSSVRPSRLPSKYYLQDVAEASLGRVQ